MALKILADENIPFAAETFGALGEVKFLPGRAITRAALSDCEALLVRSVTPVNAVLLEGTPVRFVGTATIGVDHVDLGYLQARGLAFASAAGCNANSVAEYVAAALLHWAVKSKTDLQGRTLGIVGAGNVGSRVLQKAGALGLQVLVNDPPLARKFQNEQTPPPFAFLPLDQLMQADFISLHTPLTRTGEDATHHLFDEARLAAMKPGSVLINSARGAVVDNQALKKMLHSGRMAGAILDVWENEPHPDLELLRRTHLATPHIAGYSLDGKVQGTRLIYEALCRFLGVTPCWPPADAVLPVVKKPVIEIDEPGGSVEETLHEIVRQAYDIAADDDELRTGFQRAENEEQRGRCFEQLRRAYPVRREFGNYTVALGARTCHLAAPLQQLGFQIKPPAVWPFAA